MKKTILITLAVGGALALLLAILLFLGPTHTANWDTEPVRINIPQGCTYDDLRDTLDAHEVVIRKAPAAIVFDLEARAVGLTKHVRPGSYLVPRNMKMHAFVRKLRNGQQDPLRLTIGKFRTPQQLNDYLNSKLMHNDFNIPLDSFHLVLQDTYEFYWTVTPEQFMQRMEKESAAFWQQIFSFWRFSLTKPLVLPGVDKKALANKTPKYRVMLVCRPHQQNTRRFYPK